MPTQNLSVAVDATAQNDTPAEILLEHHDGGAVWITINRPAKHNALSRSVLAALRAAIQRAGEDQTARCVIIRGAGDRFFAAGGDLVDLDTIRDEPAVLDMSEQACSALDALRTCPIPVIAALNGDAIGGGAELSMAADLRVMAAHARIGYIQGRLAITSAWGGGPDLFRIAGASRAMRMMSRTEMIPADTAMQWGIADAVLDDGLDGDAMAQFLKPILASSPRVLRGIKAQALAYRRGADWQTCRDIEREHLVKTWLHDDHWAAAEKILSKGAK